LGGFVLLRWCQQGTLVTVSVRGRGEVNYLDIERPG
jgi:hypothetical protein